MRRITREHFVKHCGEGVDVTACIDDAIRYLRRGRASRDGFFCQLKASIRASPATLDPRLFEELDRLGFH